MQVIKRLLCLICCIAIPFGMAATAETMTVTPETIVVAPEAPTELIDTGNENTYANPLLNPNTLTEYATLPDNTLNILLLGIDFGHEGYWGSGYKKILEDCHTDAVLVISVHLDTQKIDFVSLPRDTLTYVPGIRGIYKLNAAFNCGTSIEGGLNKACQAASWVLGGIKIDEYCAVDMNMMEKLGDAMGGIDFDLEMSYTGHSGTRYYKGLHHLDGTGIMDYLRSRTNATVKSNDIGRTGRQRALMIAIFEKLKQNPTLLWKVAQTALENTDDFFTSDGINSASLLAMIPFLLGMKEEDVGSYVITGKYRTALDGWNFTFTDQENRQAVIQEVYGIEVPPLTYVDYNYTKWLVESGLH
ncbi:MAG: LCP family protein, partial [Sphaerochaeta sp.]|nr:LCP family protein [Sphaerochaeta sp.]